MDLHEIFWSSSIEQLKQGYIYSTDQGTFTCIICGERYKKGIIYPENGQLFEAELAVQKHIDEQHGSPFTYLTGLNKKFTGLTDQQRELLLAFKERMSDKESAERLGVSPSTIRAHRFKLKEKEKQAKIFLAIMELLNEDDSSKDDWMHIHKGATMVDERYAITKSEQEKMVRNYFKKGPDGPLHQFPSKEKRKIIVLQHILTHFERGKTYTEKEVNEVLKAIYPDFVTIRRYLIEYGFMVRNRDGSEYWVKE
ncbi:DUF2087 domain-containing protein [Bacillus marinisedimentorum]|uniref:DUF2087 domain-containing protein n=1 Tax=Bacillus marinisedimentorum TaxID=1821260 RepID=UPI0009F5B3FB|nr:DUF2087 domain-containing protein [Bacillus marinisedimentorum]